MLVFGPGVHAPVCSINRCLAFTSSDAPTVEALLDEPPSPHAASFRDTSAAGTQAHHSRRDGGNSDDSLLPPVSRGAHISVVDVDTSPSPSLGGDKNPRCARLATGEIEIAHDKWSLQRKK